MQRGGRAILVGAVALAVVLAVRLLDSDTPTRPQARPSPTAEPAAEDLIEGGRVDCEQNLEPGGETTRRGRTPVEAARRAGGRKGRLAEVWRDEDTAVVTDSVDGKVVGVYHAGTFIDMWIVYTISRAEGC
jgi:hypothetical protein